MELNVVGAKPVTVSEAVFGKEFRLAQRTSKRGHPEYTLEVR